MQTYNGQYYNGLTGTTVPAAITLTAAQITIALEDKDGVPRQVVWFWDQVKDAPPGNRGFTLQYPGYPSQTITVADITFPDMITFYRKRKRTHRFFANRGRAAIGLVVVTVLALLTALYFWLIPLLATRVAAHVPISYEVRLGQESYASLIRNYKVRPDASRLVNGFFRQMGISSPYPVQITVVRDKEANAFALPGGHIIVHDKLLQDIRHYEELAALLSHEYAHVALRHTTKTLFRSMGTQVFIATLFGDIGGTGAVLAAQANNLKSLQYSRRLEKEADLYGLQLLEDRQIDPSGFSWLFNTLQQQGGATPSEWLSSHPDLRNRIRYIETHTRQRKPATDTALLRIWEQITAVSNE